MPRNLPNQIESPEERLISALAQTLAALQRPMARHTSEVGLTPGQFAVLSHLHRGGPTTVNDLLDQLHATSGNYSVVIDNLIKAGLVEKTRDRDDRRKRLLHLTGAGQRRIADYAPAYRSELRRLMRDTGLDEKQRLLRALRALDRQVGRAVH